MFSDIVIGLMGVVACTVLIGGYAYVCSKIVEAIKESDKEDF